MIDLQTEDEPPPRRPGFGVILSIVGALVLAYVVSGASLLYCEYNYAASLDRSAVSPINNWVLTVSSHVGVGNAAYQLEGRRPAAQHLQRRRLPADRRRRHRLLSVLTVWFPWWPLHPLGYVLTCGFTTYHTWLSIFLAWLSKSTILRFGGVRMFRAARPLFVRPRPRRVRRRRLLAVRRPRARSGSATNTTPSSSCPDSFAGSTGAADRVESRAEWELNGAFARETHPRHRLAARVGGARHDRVPQPDLPVAHGRGERADGSSTASTDWRRPPSSSWPGSCWGW